MSFLPTRFLPGLKKKLGELWWNTVLLFLVQRLGEVVNLFIGLWLVPKFLPQEELGAVTPLLSVASFAGFPIALLLIPVSKFLSVFAARNQYGKARALLRDSLFASLALFLLVSLWLFLSGGSILERLHLSDRRYLAAIAVFALLSCLEPVVAAAQRSLRCFGALAFQGFVSPYVRLAAMLLLLPLLGALGYVFSQMAMAIAAVAIGLVVLCRFFSGKGDGESYRSSLKEMLSYSLPLVALTFASRVQLPVESFVIRHRLPVETSAGYYFVSLFGAIPGYVTSALMIVLWPVVSDRHERGQSTERMLGQSLLFAAAAGTLAVLALWIAMPRIFALPGPWAGYGEYSKYVWQAGLLALFRSLQGIYVSHRGACRDFGFVKWLCPLYLAESAVLYSLPAWRLFNGYLPGFIWRRIDAWWNTSLQSFLAAMLLFNGMFLLALAADWIISRTKRASSPT